MENPSDHSPVVMNSLAINGMARPSIGQIGPPAPAASASSALSGSSGVVAPARRRGRPRKYGADGSMCVRAVPAPVAGSEVSAKRRGRPPGSGKKRKVDGLGFGGVSFTPHVITLEIGEDINAKIMAFSQKGPHCICILSASGAVSNFTLRQPGSGGEAVSYEGHFDILSLSGIFLPADDGASGGRTGGLSVALAGTDGSVLGGAVAGMLVVASPVHIFLGSFLMEGQKQKLERIKVEPLAEFDSGLVPSPLSEGTYESSEDTGNQALDHSDGFCNNACQLVGSSYV